MWSFCTTFSSTSASRPTFAEIDAVEREVGRSHLLVVTAHTVRGEQRRLTIGGDREQVPTAPDSPLRAGRLDAGGVIRGQDPQTRQAGDQEVRNAALPEHDARSPCVRTCDPARFSELDSPIAPRLLSINFRPILTEPIGPLGAIISHSRQSKRRLCRDARQRPLRGMCFLFLLSTATHAAAADRDLRLIEAVRKADKAAVRALVKQGVDVNAAEGDGRTALHWAAHAGDLDMVSVLLELGANVNAATDLGITPLWVACTNGSTAVIAKLLEAKANPNIAPESDGTPLMLASRTGNTDAVRLLLAHGADPNAKEAARGQTALMWAVAERHPDVVRLLLEKGADVHARSIASRRYVLMCCQDFEGDSAGGDYVDEGGDTPMLFAARVGDIESAKLLLSAGANIEDARADRNERAGPGRPQRPGRLRRISSRQGREPKRRRRRLHGVARGHTAQQSGPREGPPVASGESQRSADESDAGEALQRLRIRQADARRHARSCWRPDRRQLDAMRVLAANGADVNLGLDNGTNPVMAAAMRQVRGGRFAENRVVEAMKLAIELGANVNTPNIDGDTALHFAATRRLDLVVQFLVDSGATVNARNVKGQTAARGDARAGSAGEGRRPGHLRRVQLSVEPYGRHRRVASQAWRHGIGSDTRRIPRETTVEGAPDMKRLDLAAASGLTLVLLAGVTVAAQTAPAPAKTRTPVKSTKAWTAPRTPWGDPDLSGNLTNLYELDTPFERPEQFAGRTLDDIKGAELQEIRTAPSANEPLRNGRRPNRSR